MAADLVAVSNRGPVSYRVAEDGNLVARRGAGGLISTLGPALCRADVVLVNPVRDGLNVVAKEQAIVNRRQAVLCLSPQAGVWEELGGEGALAAPPFDLAGTADALFTALTMRSEERAARAGRVRAAATARTPADWLDDQLEAARTRAR